MRILIINLTRMGDIIQTIGLIEGLHTRYPEAEIDCLVMKSFSKIIQNIKAVHEPITLNDEVFASESQQINWEGFLDIKDKIEYLNTKKYDILINPIPAYQNAYLCWLIEAKQKIGMQYNEDRQIYFNSSWLSYFLANEHHLGDHAFNLVDIFAHIGEVSADINNFRLQPSVRATEKAIEFWKTHQLYHYRTIAFHVGASRSNKAWESEKFISVIRELLEDDRYRIIVFGGYQERELLSFFNEIDSPNCINLIDQLSIDELIAFISNVQLFVTNDTGPMHIAAAMKRPIINISLGPVSVWETGPYSNQSLAIQANIDCHPCKFEQECSHLSCHKLVKPHQVSQIILAWYNHLYENFPLTLPSYPHLLIWKSTTDSMGLQYLIPIEKRKLTEKEFLFEIKRCVWVITLFQKEKQSSQILQQTIDYLQQFYILSRYQPQAILSVLSEMNEQTQHIVSLFQRMLSLPLNTKKNIDSLKMIWQEADMVKNEMIALAKSTSYCQDWLDYIRFKESSIMDTSVVNQITNTLQLYQTLQNQIQTTMRAFLLSGTE